MLMKEIESLKMVRKSEIRKKIDLIIELKKNGVFCSKVLKVIEEVDRNLFIDVSLKSKSNLNTALPINCGQTISQPLVVALMTQSLDIEHSMRILEVGTGSGYQTYILSKLSRFVYTIERFKSLSLKASDLFKKLNVSNIFCRHGDGGHGWKDQAPFERIIVTACAHDIPSNLVDQLSINGKMIVPIGEQHNDQILKKITKLKGELIIDDLVKVRFVPLLEGKENK